MPSIKSVHGLIEEKIIEQGISRDSFTLGDEYKDDSFCLFLEKEDWVVGWNERGKHWEKARFKDDISAAEYLIFWVLKDTSRIQFPKIDWTAYASLP